MAPDTERLIASITKDTSCVVVHPDISAGSTSPLTAEAAHAGALPWWLPSRLRSA
jgi:hypothetical protein